MRFWELAFDKLPIQRKIKLSGRRSLSRPNHANGSTERPDHFVFRQKWFTYYKSVMLPDVNISIVEGKENTNYLTMFQSFLVFFVSDRISSTFQSSFYFFAGHSVKTKRLFILKWRQRTMQKDYILISAWMKLQWYPSNYNSSNKLKKLNLWKRHV